jgi:hypothetical protein
MTIIAISILLFFELEKIDRHSNATYLIATKRKAKKAGHKAESFLPNWDKDAASKTMVRPTGFQKYG